MMVLWTLAACGFKAHEVYGGYWHGFFLEGWTDEERGFIRTPDKIQNDPIWWGWRAFKGFGLWERQDPGPSWRKHVPDNALTRMEEHEGFISPKKD